jgi:D-amino peptidase
MKIMIMTDMEGVAGVLNHDDWVLRNGQFYEQGVRLLTLEVNAAVDGFFAGGASEVRVVDGHGQGGIDPELLDDRATLMRGVTQPVWPWAMDKTFAGLAHVGQHAKAGTPYSHITHTGWFDYIDLSVNGLSIGEYGQMALCAMELGVPCILACGEDAFATEAEALTPGVVTVGVKRGLVQDGLEHLDTDEYRKAKLGAIHVSPIEARRRIRTAAETSILRLRKSPESFSFPAIKPPYVQISRIRRNGASPAHVERTEHPDSIIGLFNAPAQIVKEPKAKPAKQTRKGKAK